MQALAITVSAPRNCDVAVTNSMHRSLDTALFILHGVVYACSTRTCILRLHSIGSGPGTHLGSEAHTHACRLRKCGSRDKPSSCRLWGVCAPRLPTTHANTHGRIGSWIPNPGSRFRTVVPATTGTMQQLTSDVSYLNFPMALHACLVTVSVCLLLYECVTVDVRV